MSTIEIAFKHSGHNHILRDVTSADADSVRADWVSGKGRVLFIGPILYARDSIAWIRITD